MKKIIIVCLLIVLFSFSKKEEIKIRVIPNSNSTEDLIVKDKVKKELENYINTYLLEIESYKEMKEKISNDVSNISSELNKIANVKVSFKNHNMGIKSYNGKVVFNSSLTLLAEIEDAKGDNWWGTLYPSLLGISTDEKVNYKFWIGG